MLKFLRVVIQRALLAGLLMVNYTTKAQIVQDTGDLLIEIADVISTMPSSTGNDYTAPSPSQMMTWTNALNALFSGDFMTSSDSLSAIGYDLIEFSDTTNALFTTYYILKSSSTNYWGTYVYNPQCCREIVIQSPHPQKDLKTGLEGVYVFKETQALFFCLSGTNRCNSSTYSTCTGTTTVCAGSQEDYRVSDLAHNTTTIFQQTTSVLFSTFSNSYFIQLHGFTKKSTDPYVILSNGTQITPNPDFISIFKSNLVAEDNTLTFKIAHIDLTWTRLRGFYNTQGRLINGSSDNCNTNAVTTNGRFIHMEQERTKLRKDTIGWTKVANALKNTFTCSPLSIASVYYGTGMRIFPNPTLEKVFVETENTDFSQVRIFNLLGEDVTDLVRITKTGLRQMFIDLKWLPVGGYVIKTQSSFGMVFKQ